MAHAHALAAKFSLAAHGEVDNAPLAAIHRAEVERNFGFLHPLRRGHRAHPQFFDPEHAVVVGVEAKARVILTRHAQRLHRELFEGEKDFGFVRKQLRNVLAAELDHQLGTLDFRVDGGTFHDFPGDVETGCG